ncbi:cupin domain-containing protein [Acinetobacter sp. ANC 7086]|nr:cupin domain-containing protein [Acinetobacter amyesii]MCL6239918.1 cupin domain-containing protein [Acinetobacter amyesii]
MHLHADFSKPIIITPQDYHWVKSPGGQVNRMMLDRIGAEKARATSVVEFSPQTPFTEHTHPLGEEVLVLTGTFTENEDQHYLAGWYMRNPHQSSHRVSSEMGCQIFVKLIQMTEHEVTPTRINTHDSKH